MALITLLMQIIHDLNSLILAQSIRNQSWLLSFSSSNALFNLSDLSMFCPILFLYRPSKPNWKCLYFLDSKIKLEPWNIFWINPERRDRSFRRKGANTRQTFSANTHTLTTHPHIPITNKTKYAHIDVYCIPPHTHAHAFFLPSTFHLRIVREL